MRYALAMRNYALLLLLVLSTAACGADTRLAPAPATGPAPNVAPGANDSAAPSGSNWDRQIIRTATLNLEVTDVEAALRAVRNLATAANGFVFSSSSEYKGAVLVATITIQVPGEQFDPVMTSVRKIGQRVTSEVSSSQDVTEEYIDLSSQLKNLQAQEDQLRVLMGRAGTVDEVLRVQHELSDVQGHMEQIQGRLNYLSHRTEFSTITTNLAPPGGPAATDWQPLATATQSWQASLAVLARLTDALVGVLVFSWWMIVLLVLAVVLLRRRRRRPVRLPPAPPVA